MALSIAVGARTYVTVALRFFPLKTCQSVHCAPRNEKQPNRYCISGDPMYVWPTLLFV